MKKAGALVARAFASLIGDIKQSDESAYPGLLACAHYNKHDGGLQIPDAQPQSHDSPLPVACGKSRYNWSPHDMKYHCPVEWPSVLPLSTQFM